MLGVMARARTYRVKELADLTRVSVRTLHYYDEIGLLSPKARSGGGYREYDDADLLRLQQILLGRELGLPLEDIRRTLDDPTFDRERALRDQRQALLERLAHTEHMLRAIDAALALISNEGKPTMDAKTLFDGFDPETHEAETQARWGNTDSYAESKRRTATYSAEDWQRFKAEQAAIYADLVAARAAGRAPSDEPVRAIVDRHRDAIDRWFYPCSQARHRALADMYESDARFRANIDTHGAGLTDFLVAAIRASSTRQ